MLLLRSASSASNKTRKDRCRTRPDEFTQYSSGRGPLGGKAFKKNNPSGMKTLTLGFVKASHYISIRWRGVMQFFGVAEATIRLTV